MGTATTGGEATSGRLRRRTGILAILGILVFVQASWSMRSEVDLSGPGWKLWLDRTAEWEEDELHLPPVNLADLPSRPPTGGWAMLGDEGLAVEIPSTVEAYLWDELGGDYKGVSWWWRAFKTPAVEPGGRVLLRFASVRLRAEVFVNQRLVGYDVIGNTPFEVDITDAVKPGENNQLAVRITDPSGNFDWIDFLAHRWGKYSIPASHGFGGVTGGVQLIAVPDVSVDDVFVQNTPQMREVEVAVTIENRTGGPVTRDVRFEIIEAGANGAMVFSETCANQTFAEGSAVFRRRIAVPDAKLWHMDTPHLYRCQVALGDTDAQAVTFGFRWFAIDGVGENAHFRLNGRRIVLRSAISWGFWPVSGMVPTPELARREIDSAKRLGLNMINFHRCIGRPLLFELSDELGLLRFEEPGGYAAHSGDAFCRQWAREKLLRMVRRDRNHPSLVIYNMINEENEILPDDQRRQDMADAHRLDPTRTITYTSGWNKEGDDPYKLHMRPYDDRQYTEGWYDYHNAAGPGSYQDGHYNGPRDFARYTPNRKEIVFWGEEGANATPPRLARIVEELADGRPGWDGSAYRAWHQAYVDFLKQKNLAKDFPSVDALTVSMGGLQYYYQGRFIENIRLGDATDGYVINGWESEKLENHSGVVDCFRNLKGDPDLIARYNAPCYVAVKLRAKLGHAPLATVADIYIVNEVDLQGPHDLAITLVDAAGSVLWSETREVQVRGGEVYGELLAEAVAIEAACPAGRYTVKAELKDAAGAVRAAGDDEILLVDWRSVPLPAGGAVLEDGAAVGAFLSGQKQLKLPTYQPDMPRLDYLLIGEMALVEPEVIPSEALVPADGSGTGLTGTYYKGEDFHRFVEQRVDPQVDFDFSQQGPSRAIGREAYAIRWQGQIRAPESGAFQLHTVSDDGIRLWFDGRRIIDHWSSHGPVRDSTPPMELEAGKLYDVRMEYFQRFGGAIARLLWTRPSMARKWALTVDDVARRVRDDGTTVVVLAGADEWARLLAERGLLAYQGRMNHGMWWLGGNFFVRPHALFEGLPVGGAFNWEYQDLISYQRKRFGLLLENEEVVVGSVSDHQPVVSTAVGVVRAGKGRIVLSTLDMVGRLGDPARPAEVTRQLLCNYVRYAGEAHHD